MQDSGFLYFCMVQMRRRACRSGAITDTKEKMRTPINTHLSDGHYFRGSSFGLLSRCLMMPNSIGLLFSSFSEPASSLVRPVAVDVLQEIPYCMHVM